MVFKAIEIFVIISILFSFANRVFLFSLGSVSDLLCRIRTAMICGVESSCLTDRRHVVVPFSPSLHFRTETLTCCALWLEVAGLAEHLKVGSR